MKEPWRQVCIAHFCVRKYALDPYYKLFLAKLSGDIVDEKGTPSSEKAANVDSTFGLKGENSQQPTSTPLLDDLRRKKMEKKERRIQAAKRDREAKLAAKKAKKKQAAHEIATEKKSADKDQGRKKEKAAKKMAKVQQTSEDLRRNMNKNSGDKPNVVIVKRDHFLDNGSKSPVVPNKNQSHDIMSKVTQVNAVLDTGKVETSHDRKYNQYGGRGRGRGAFPNRGFYSATSRGRGGSRGYQGNG